MALSRVPGLDDLYVGGIFTLRRKATLESAGITHVVSVLKYDFKDFEDWERFGHLQIEVDDVDDENLLGEFERTGKWIDEALRNGKDGKKGGVLVHCAMGKSRSVTIAVAYLLRKYPKHSVESALSLIRESRPMAEPNDGFMEQLKLYKEMGCPHDIDAQPRYQRWLYQREVDLALAAGMAPEKVRFEDEEVQDSNEGSQSDSKIELRCRKCRRTLATTPYLVNHISDPAKPSQPASPETGPISSLSELLPPTTLQNVCTHHFLLPLSWMRPILEQGLLEGRLECPNPKCAVHVGRYAWQGMKCSCGIWICPAFSLQKGRVDEILKRSISRQTFEKSGSGSSIVGGIEASRRETGIRLPPGFKENL